MNIERETLTVEEYASFLAFGNQEGTCESPIPGEFFHDQGRIWFCSGGSQCVGSAFLQWHSGMDAVYAVGSATIADVGIDLNTLQDAVDLLKKVNVFNSEYDRVERDWLVEISETALRSSPSNDLQMVHE